MAQTAQLITTPFGRETTAAEVVEGIDLKDKRAVVTGGGSGIGVETARALAGAGAAVTLAVRRPADGEKVAEDIRSSTGNDEVRVAPLELTDYASIAALSASWEGPLDILVNNAGVMAIQELTLTDRGQEMQFVTNHLGHFALALGLHDALAAAENARIVSVSSSGHLRSPIVFDRQPEAEILPTCRELGIGFGAYSPLGRGFLSGRFSSPDELGEDDFRRTQPCFQGENLEANMRIVAKLREIAEEKDITPAQLALAWVLAQGEDIVPIPGTKRRKYLEENAAAADVELTDEELARIDESCPRSPETATRPWAWPR